MTNFCLSILRMSLNLIITDGVELVRMSKMKLVKSYAVFSGKDCHCYLSNCKYDHAPTAEAVPQYLEDYDTGGVWGGKEDNLVK